MDDLFQKASRQALRFASDRGGLTVEQLWDLPLTAANGFSLDGVGRGISAELRTLTEDSLVETKPDPRKVVLELQLEIVKAIIGTKQAENAARLAASDKAAKRQKIREAIAAQEDQELTSASKGQLMKMLAELDD